MRPPRTGNKSLVTALSLVGLVSLCASYPFWVTRARGGSPVRSGACAGEWCPCSLFFLNLTFSSHPSPPTPTHSPPQIDSSKPLPRQAAIRGPYTNTGSRDVGLDPNPKLSPPKL